MTPGESRLFLRGGPGGVLAAMSAAVLWVVVQSGCAPIQAPPGPSRHAPALAPAHLIAADGAALPLRRWLPEQRPRAVVLGLHGFNDYSRAFEAPAKTFVKAGIAVYAYDQRGFGESPNRGVWPGVQGMVEDLRAAAALVRAAHPGTPFFILGESMGAAVVMAAMNRAEPPPPADGYILAAPAVWGWRVMPGWQRAGLELFAHLVPLLTVTGQGFNRVPSDNEEMLRSLGRDPLVIKHTRVDAIWGLVNLMDAALAATPRLRGRTLILLGQQEDILPGAATTALLDGLPPDRCVQVARYRSGFHMLLRDLQADIVLGDLAAWMAAPGRGLPSGADRAATTAAAQESGARRTVALDCGAPLAARP